MILDLSINVRVWKGGNKKMFKIKKYNSLILAFVLSFTILNSSVIAKADVDKTYSIESVNNITVKVNLSDDNFDGQIYFFINDSKGIKRVFVLNKNDNFSSTYELPIGEAKILNITFYDKDKNVISLPYTYSGELNTTTDKAATFTINVDNCISKSKELEKTSSSEETNSSESKNADNSNKTTKEEKGDSSNEEKNEQPQEENNSSNSLNRKTKINFAIDIAFFSIVGGLAIYLKYKDYKKKKTNKDAGKEE